MWKPIGIIVGIMAVVALGLFCLNRYAVYTNASGRPLDAATAAHYCLNCGRLGLRPDKGYWCECANCGLRFQAKIDLGDGNSENW